jgi:aryl-alcohol dehydrogenase-like predicted oxidoreductase
MKAMRYTTFGRRTGLRVSEYGLGAGNFGTAWGTGAEHPEAKAIFDGFADAGGTLIDTADSYQFGESETMLADFLAADREHFVVASKYASGGPNGSVSRSGGGRKHMRYSVEQSLRRLGTDHLDLYWVHFPDPATPAEEILRGMDDLVSAGKILHFGLSNFPAWRVSHAAAVAGLRGWAPVAGIQVEYSLAERTPERELLPMADALGLGVAQWSPLGGGVLTGKYRQSADGRAGVLPQLVHADGSVVDEVLAVAGELAVPPSQVAMAWLRERARRAPTAYVPIIGPRTSAQLTDYLEALDVTLPAAAYTRLDEASAVPLGVPHTVAAGAVDNTLGGDRTVVDLPVVPVT